MMFSAAVIFVLAWAFALVTGYLAGRHETARTGALFLIGFGLLLCGLGLVGVAA